MCRTDIFDDPTIGWSEKIRHARKDHICRECGRDIKKGERYWYASGISDKRPFDSKTCEHCHVISDWLSVNCAGYLYSEQLEDFSEHAEASQKMLRLVVGARRRWRSFSDPMKRLPIPAYPGDMV